jgi:hypothetical protein
MTKRASFPSPRLRRGGVRGGGCRCRAASEEADPPASTPPASRPPTLALPSASGGRGQRCLALRTGDNSRRAALTDTPQPADPRRLSRAPQESARALIPIRRTCRMLPAPSVLVEASSGGAGDGAEGRFSRAAASPAGSRGRRREHRPFGPRGRIRAGGDRCARSSLEAGERDRRVGATLSAGGPGARGTPRLREARPGAVAGSAPRRFPARDAAGRAPSLLPRRPGRAARSTTNAAVKRREARRLAWGPFPRVSPDA